MSIGALTPGGPLGPPGPGSADDRLRQAAEDMEGVFVQHLTRALRATVPNGGNPDAPGADLYGSLLDEHLAEVLAKDANSGIAEALYRQLSGGVGDAPLEARNQLSEGSDG